MFPTNNRSLFSNESASCETPWTWASVMIVANLLSTMVGAIGNSLVCIAVWKTASLRTTINYHMVSLAIADLIVTVIVQPLMIAVIVGKATGDLECSSTLDKVYRTIGNFSCAASFLNLCFISLERLLAILRPFSTYKNTKSKRFIFVMFAIWLIPFGYAVLRTTTSRKGTSYFSGALFAVGYVWMVSCYAVILVNLHIQAKKPVAITLNEKKQRRTERKITMTMILVIVCFTVMWLPLFYFRLSGNSSLNSGLVYELAITVALCNSALNPIIYSFRNKKYRNAFKSILLNRYRIRSRTTKRTVISRAHGPHSDETRQASSALTTASSTPATERRYLTSQNLTEPEQSTKL